MHALAHMGIRGGIAGASVMRAGKGASLVVRGATDKRANLSYVPAAPPLPEEHVEAVVQAIRGSKKVVVLTGAGISTESSIPDYRGPQGAYQTGFKPMTHQQFMANHENRARYFARSFYGWPEFSSTQPNIGHEALAQLQRQGWVDTIITQNVDRLHQSAGATRVIELHGTTHEVRCMMCGSLSCRHQLQREIADLNPEAALELAARMQLGDYKAWQQHLKERAGTRAEGGGDVVPVRRPDGDVEIKDAGVGFHIPSCGSCGKGPLKPDVVFFGDNLTPKIADQAMYEAEHCDLMIAIGTSMMTLSAFRLAQAAVRRGRLMVLNVGSTRADDKLPMVKLEAVAGETLTRLASHPSLLLPRLPGDSLAAGGTELSSVWVTLGAK